ncbi:putative two component transcriptional regulator, LuxR family [Leadbettera azotonutricia ZAS-9]|uniref:Putative two component transcriptional regulator, LuxR family n=2 Tax=Leadbettera azotonutricia TaxID=150829 RepID=F5YB99_LEAAZ|nr:putative two component transcriptional regulator, LuxR family [Leadbettera azotonutricia ZAS-9]
MLSPVLLVSRSESLNLLGIYLLKQLHLRRVMATTKGGRDLNRLISMLSPELILFDAVFYLSATPRRIGLLLKDRPDLNIAVINVNSYQAEGLVEFLRFGVKSVIDFNSGLSSFRRALKKVLRNEAYISGNVEEAYEALPDDIPDLKLDLTDRQEDVKRLILDGKSSKEIADTLGVSVKTVEIHKKALFTSYCVKNSLGLFKQCFLLDEIRRDDLCM